MGMKNPLELLNTVKTLVQAFNEMPEVPAEPVTAEAPSYSLADGTKVMISELAVGGVVTLEDGSPAPEGSHTLADGTVIEVASEGVIANIVPPAAEEVEEPEAEDMGKKYDERFSAIEASFAAFKQEHENLKAAFGKQSEAMQGLIELVETLVKEPAGEPVEKPNTFKRHSTADTIKSAINRFQSLKNKN